MAVIKETLAIENQFSEALSRYISLMTEGSASTREMQAAARELSKDARAVASVSRAAAAQNNAAAAAARAQAAQTSALASQERIEAQRARAAARAQREQADAQRDTRDAASALTDQIKRLVGAYVGVQSIGQLVSMADQVTQLDARLQQMTGSAEGAAAAQEMIYQAAQRSRGEYLSMANLVSQLGSMAPEAFSDANGNINTAELVGFAEQLQKQMTISGASGEGVSAAMIQLTQALSSGVLRGEELNSVLEQTPIVARTIAEYMGVSIGEMRELASEGAITADVVKNAILGAAEETDAAFASMPMTWSQVWTSMQNVALQALQPVLNAISWLASNLDIVAPIVLGVAAAIGTLTVAINGAKMATATMTAAQDMLNIVMTANPIGLVVAGLALLVGALYAGVAAFNKLSGSSVSATGIITGAIAFAGAVVGNAFIAVSNTALSVFGGIFNTVASVANFVGNVFNNPLAAAAHLFGDFADTVLGVLQTIAGVIDVVFGSGLSDAVSGWRASLNGFIDRAAGNYTEFVPKLDVSGAQMGRIGYGDAWNTGYDWGANLGSSLGDMFGAAMPGGETSFSVPSYDDIVSAIDGVGKDVKGIKKSVDLSKEDLKYMVDLTARRYVNNVNLTSQTPVITVNGQNTGNTEADREALARMLETILLEQRAAGAAMTIAPRLAF